MICYGTAVQRKVILGVSVRKMKELIGKDRQNLACLVSLYIKCMKLIVKYFFLSRHFTFGGSS